ncbi:Acetyltransferase (GNAT) domain-containing protein [Paramicrobacterium humi]|uniref:Acetyltransferase (GNAT) domain-containing protein n=1 Tax=Paramicrobacterium humi TaxID=640635 RepID=A0A1H4JIW8_9MICO|nr:Acetyltransferase (GNAT) domain-containing protein [Microbacterium humi]
MHDIAAATRDLALQTAGARLTTIDECESFIAERLPCTASVVNLAIAEDDVPVGNVGLSNIEYSHGTAWAYYWLAEGARGRGLATRALASIAQWAFTEQALHRLELGHRVNNPASCGVATRAGFATEGVEREKLRYGTERFDVERHARLATDAAPQIEPIRVEA